MPIVIVEAVAPVASWRAPEALTYHRTFPLPPYTSLVGLLGAALGLDLPGAYRYVVDRDLRLGIGGSHEGRMRDLWKFQKLELVAEGKESKTDVLLREYWTESRLALVFESPDARGAEELAGAFRRPAFPLTAGPSDALMKAAAVRVEDIPLTAERRLAHVLVFGEISPRYGLYEDIAKVPLNRVIRAPSVERIPIGFDFSSDGPRRLTGRSMVTFVADPIVLEETEAPVFGYQITPQSEPLRSSPAISSWIGELPWTIPVHRYESKPPEADSSTTPSPSARTPRKGKSGKPTVNT
jgi:CRISPR-associated protein Cas5t